MKINIPYLNRPTEIGIVRSVLRAAALAVGAMKPEARETGPPARVPAFLLSAG